ncbi:hypothetical protein pb186bvf_019256 [Paramecium bursaria]
MLGIELDTLQKKVKLLEERLSYFENCFQLSEKKVLEINRQFEIFIRQIADFNLGIKRVEDRYEGQIIQIERAVHSLQKEIHLIEKTNDDKINQLISQLVEPSFKDVDQSIKQETQYVQKQFQRQIDQLQESINQKLSSNSKEETKKKIDEEINRRIEEENDKRKQQIDGESKIHKSTRNLEQIIAREESQTRKNKLIK